MAQVLFDKATRVYPGTELPALDDLDLDVADGEFLVVRASCLGCGFPWKPENDPPSPLAILSTARQ